MAVVSIVAVVAVLLGAAGGYALSKRAVEWCPTCGRSLAGHCPDAADSGSARRCRAPFRVARW
jgi:hypothetical protein